MKTFTTRIKHECDAKVAVKDYSIYNEYCSREGIFQVGDKAWLCNQHYHLFRDVYGEL